MPPKRQRKPEPADLSPQAKAVEAAMLEEAVFDAGVVSKEVDTFFNKLGLPAVYFQEMPVEEVARHITSLQAAKLLARASGHPFDINLQQESEDRAMFAARSVVSTTKDNSTVRLLKPNSGQSPARAAERYIEDKYLSGGVATDKEADAATGTSGIENVFRSDVPAFSLSKAGGVEHKSVTFRLQCYRSAAAIDESGSHLRLYFLRKPEFVNPHPAPGVVDVGELGDRAFVESVSPEFREYYQTVLTEASNRLGPAIHVFRSSSHLSTPIAGAGAGTSGLGDETLHLLVGFRAGSTHSYFTALSDVYRTYHLFAVEKYVEPFSNGVTIYAFHLRALGPKAGDFDHLIQNLVRDCSLHYVLPRTSLTPLLTRGLLNAQEVAYAYAAWKFAFHFLSRGGDELHAIESALAPGAIAGDLSKVRKALKTHAFTEGSILDCLFRNYAVIQKLYKHFVAMHDPHTHEEPESDSAMESYLSRSLNTDLDLQTFKAMLSFNLHILKTNFFRSIKTALSFRLDPGFLSPRDFPARPHGVFFVIGSECRGFHIRFRDVARGGIRVVKSAYAQAFANNVASMFEECYNLAHTQQLKNKDICEGGSKGVILLNLAHQDKAVVAFQKYVDSVLDLLMPGDEVKDRLGATEILFFGPDENTADVMDWAAKHARGRGYPFWKAFTTGKSTALGGIPHDVYGMTTHSVRQYAMGIQRKLALDGPACFKVQTGGPDGDLGSNEILMGNEKTTAIVDGSGVLYDPAGLNQDELKRLARERKMVSHVDMSKLSSTAALVLLSDKDKRLPDGTVVENGMTFRNTFHLRPLCNGDFFIPCGGRPAAVNVDNVDAFTYRPDGSLRFKYVVEGANLFFTQDARKKLEAAGVVLFKDASANKGGVTSSSLEVMAALVLNDDEFTTHMTVPAVADGEESKSEPPAMYQTYVREVQSIIDTNAQLEFECLWRERERTGKPSYELTDLLSTKITELSARIEDNDSLWKNETLRSFVLHEAVPKTLASLLGGPDKVLARLPENYCRALFGSRLASRFIYQAGLTTPEFAFFEYISTCLDAK